MATTRVILTFPWNNNKSNEKLLKHNASGLTDSVLKLAKKELREDETTREQALEQMREWLKKNNDVENVRTDDSYLLRFLRNKKFSVPMAQQQLLKLLNMRHVMSHLSQNLDFLSPGVLAIINNGYIFASPIRDEKGRRVMLYFAKGLNGIKYTMADQCQAHYIAYETLLECEQNQICGVVHVGDFEGASTQHVSVWKNPIDFMKILKWGEQSIPLRHKEIHIANVATVLKYVIEAGKTIISNKMGNRIHIYSNMEDIKKKVSIDVLPKEMGGKIPMAEMIELWKAELASKRDILLAMDKMKILSDQGIIGKRNFDKNNNTVSSNAFQESQVTGSFRKLEFD